MDLAPTAGGSRQQASRRKVSHVTRACDRCRKRRIRCDGAQPMCGTCAGRGWDCTYMDEDGRKNTSTVDNLKTRVALLENILSSNGLDRGQLGNRPQPTLPPPPNPRNEGVLAPSGLAPFITEPVPIESSGLTPFLGSSPATSTSHSGGPLSPMKRRFSAASPHDEFSQTERLKRRRDGGLVYSSSTSVWHFDRRNTARSPRPVSPPAAPPDWRRIIPPLDISRERHDDALSVFAAYYAPWCFVVDMPAFMRDQTDRLGAMTSSYSPLLHCAVLFMGLSILGGHNDLASLWEVCNDHCMRLVIRECAAPTLASLRGINLLASCLNFRTELGYTVFGLVPASIQILGLTVNTEPYVRRGQLTEEEHQLRQATYWTMYVQDILRAIAAGRSPLLPVAPELSDPSIDPALDREPWVLPDCFLADAPPDARALSGLPSLRSTILHWTVKLAQILRAVFDSLYSVRTEDTVRASAPTTLMRRLTTWLRGMPIKDASACPLPHVLLLHMLYRLVVIYLHRPFYRTAGDAVPSSAERCNEAAEALLRLLTVYDELHGLQHAPLTINQIIFGTSTIFMLRAASQQSEGVDCKASLDCLEECVRLMSHHARTWEAADSTFDIIRTLRSEWLPEREEVEGIQAAPDAQPLPVLDGLPDWLMSEWFLNQDLLDLVSCFASGQLPVPSDTTPFQS